MDGALRVALQAAKEASTEENSMSKILVGNVVVLERTKSYVRHYEEYCPLAFISRRLDDKSTSKPKPGAEPRYLLARNNPQWTPCMAASEACTGVPKHDAEKCKWKRSLDAQNNVFGEPQLQQL